MPPEYLPSSRLKAFEKRLEGIDSVGALIETTRREVQETVGYKNIWFAVFEPKMKMARVLGVSGAEADDGWAIAPVIPIEADPFMQRVLDTGETQIVVDAQLDPEVNREIVGQLGNRTIVQLPMNLVGTRFGTLGTGTFGDEGVRVPTDEEKAYLEKIASLFAEASHHLLRDHVEAWLA